MFKVVALIADIMSDSNFQSATTNVVLCIQENGERVHRFLQESGFLETTRKPKSIGKMLALPFNLQVNKKDLEEILQDTFDFEVQIDSIELEATETSNNPHARLLRAVVAWLSSQQMLENENVLSNLPKKWQLLGDLVILPEAAFTSEYWREIFDKTTRHERDDFWFHVAKALGGERLARQHPIAKDKHRSSQTELLLGENGWVEFLDHGVKFGFDATKVMFSAGNVTERRRIGSIAMDGEVVVDAYAGIGYYTLHMASRSKAKHIHACEINPDSISGLCWAQEANGFEQSVTVHSGDNQETLPKLYGQADRCHLGLLPSSEAVWEHAIRCLKPKGGWLHIHMNVHKNNLEEWTTATLDILEKYAENHGRNWQIKAAHLERVKWFSPHVWHVVLDVECKEHS
jgi:tRNA wybutosine-synthesizing protein 3